MMKKATVITVQDVFELAGQFSTAVIDAFNVLNDLAEGRSEMVRYELELVEDLCTNTSKSMSEEQLLRVAAFLKSKLDSLE